MKFYNYYFDEFLENIDLIFTSEEIIVDFWFNKDVSPYYVKEIGLGDHPFHLNPRA